MVPSCNMRLFSRIQADSFRDMQDKINKPISIAKEIILRQSLNDRFIEAFVEQVRSNPRFDYRNVEVCFC